jgi:hypothetical protein
LRLVGQVRHLSGMTPPTAGTHRSFAMRTILGIATALGLLVSASPARAASRLPPRPPQAVLQFEPCFPTPEQRLEVIRTITAALTDPETDTRPDVRSTCSNEQWLFGRETLGVWLTPVPLNELLRDAVNDARDRGLAEVDVMPNDVGNGMKFGWSVAAGFIEGVRARIWAMLPKRLNDDGEPDDDGSVHIQALTVRLLEPDRIRTDLTGFYDVGPNADFRLRTTDTITLEDRKLRHDCVQSLYIDTSAYEWLAGLITPFVPPLGIALFDEIDRQIAGLQTPNVCDQSLGTLVTQFAPDEVMFEGEQKLSFYHTTFLIDATGVIGQGISAIEPRSPMVSIAGPRNVIAASRSVTLRFSAVTDDLRATEDQRLQYRWTSDGAVANDRARSTDITFQIPGNIGVGGESAQRVSVRVTDADGMTASRSATIRLRYEPIDWPPICDTKPYLPQCGRPMGEQHPLP